MAQKQWIDIWQGENRVLPLAARDNSNNASNLTGKTLTWVVSFPPYDPDLNLAILTKVGTITDASGGLYTIAITPEDTQCMTAGNYLYQTATTDNTGSVSIVTEGTFRLREIVRPLS